MKARFSNNLALALLVVAAFFAVQIGGSLGRGLTILAVMAWILAIILIVYLILFRDVSFKPSWLSRDKDADNDQVDAFEENYSEPGEEEDFSVNAQIAAQNSTRDGDRSAT